jgi:hypothetical protein
MDRCKGKFSSEALRLILTSDEMKFYEEFTDSISNLKKTNSGKENEVCNVCKTNFSNNLMVKCEPNNSDFDYGRDSVFDNYEKCSSSGSSVGDSSSSSCEDVF